MPFDYVAKETTPADDSNLFNRVVEGERYIVKQSGVPNYVEIIHGRVYDKDMGWCEAKGLLLAIDRIAPYCKLI